MYFVSTVYIVGCTLLDKAHPVSGIEQSGWLDLPDCSQLSQPVSCERSVLNYNFSAIIFLVDGMLGAIRYMHKEKHRRKNSQSISKEILCELEF